MRRRAETGLDPRACDNGHMTRIVCCAITLAAIAFPAAGQAKGSKADYQADVKFAIDEIGKQCQPLLTSKKIDGKKVTAALLVESKKTKNDAGHLLLLWRLLARLQDGHAEVRPLELGKGVKRASKTAGASRAWAWCRTNSSRSTPPI